MSSRTHTHDGGRVTYQIQSRSGLEPLDLSLIEGMRQRDLVLGTILVLNFQGQVDARGKGIEALNGNLVRGLDLIVVRRVSERQCKHSLLFQVGLVNTGERAGDNRQTAEESGFQSGVLTRGTFSVVVITDDDPLDTPIAVISSSLRDSSPFTGDLVLDLVRLAVFNVDGTNQAVLGNVLQVPSVLKPGSTGGNVVGGWRTDQYTT